MGHLAHPSTEPRHEVSVRPRLYRTPRTSAPNPARDHIRIATHSSRAAATKIAVISAPMILTIAVPSSVLSYSGGCAMGMPEADRPQLHGSSSWTRLPATPEAGDVPDKRETCPPMRAYFPRLRRVAEVTEVGQG